MKKQILYHSFVIAVVLGAYATANSVSAQMVGNYADASASSKEVVRAAKFAVSTYNASSGHAKVTLDSITKAERQVVAGMNYRIVLLVVDRLHMLSFVATAVIYQNLKNHLSLTSWTPGEGESGLFDRWGSKFGKD